MICRCWYWAGRVSSAPNWSARFTRAERQSSLSKEVVRVAKALGPISSQVRILITDLAERGAAARLIDEAAPEVVFNLAGYGVDRSERALSLMTAINARMVAELCTHLSARPSGTWSGLKLVQAGSAWITVASTVRCTKPPRRIPRRIMVGRSSKERSLCKRVAAHPDSKRLSPASSPFTPGDYPDKLLPALLRTAASGTPLRLSSGRQRRNFVYVEDVVDGLLRLAACRASSGQIVNLATDHLTSVRQFVETAADVLGIDACASSLRRTARSR